MSAIMISIRPEWVEKILNHSKTIEIRKTEPKIELPCKVYIYCTKNNGKGMGEYPFYQFCDNKLNDLNGKVVAEFTLNKITTHLHNFIDCEEQESYNFYIEDVKNAGVNTEIDDLLDFDEFVEEYGKGKPLYAWHIDDLKIYDKPKELGEFRRRNKCHYSNYEDGCCFECCTFYDLGECDGQYSKIERPPQSWCYVEYDKRISDISGLKKDIDDLFGKSKKEKKNNENI